MLGVRCNAMPAFLEWGRSYDYVEIYLVFCTRKLKKRNESWQRSLEQASAAFGECVLWGH